MNVDTFVSHWSVMVNNQFWINMANCPKWIPWLRFNAPLRHPAAHRGPWNGARVPVAPPACRELRLPNGWQAVDSLDDPLAATTLEPTELPMVYNPLCLWGVSKQSPAYAQAAVFHATASPGDLRCTALPLGNGALVLPLELRVVPTWDPTQVPVANEFVVPTHPKT